MEERKCRNCGNVIEAHAFCNTECRLEWYRVSGTQARYQRNSDERFRLHNTRLTQGFYEREDELRRLAGKSPGDYARQQIQETKGRL